MRRRLLERIYVWLFCKDKNHCIGLCQRYGRRRRTDL